MNFRSIWQPSSEQEPAAFWLNPDLRAEITIASQRIDERLQRDPYGISESRWGDLRIMFESPYGVFFFVDDSTRTVHILHIWRFKPRTLNS